MEMAKEAIELVLEHRAARGVSIDPQSMQILRTVTVAIPEPLA